MSPRFPFALACAALAACGAPCASAVNVQPDKLPNRGVFAIELDQERQFYGRADHVISVSLQEYATESFIVTEVVVDMANSSQQVRLYSVRTPGAAEAADALNAVREAAASARGVPVPAAAVSPAPVAKAKEKLTAAQNALPLRPTKSYPLATHAHTIEYLVRDRAELVAFFKAFRDLLAGKEVPAGEGDSVSGRNTAFGTSSTASKPMVNRLGGTVFGLRP